MTIAKQTSKQIGDTFEKMACAFLVQKGLQIIQTNFTVPQVGEIDIIAHQMQYLKNGQRYPILVFVEVKARHSKSLVSALQAVTKAKQQRIVRTAEHFLQNHDEYAAYACRFDVVAFEIDTACMPQVHWVQGAFLAQ